jgi:hypothetical protein
VEVKKLDKQVMCCFCGTRLADSQAVLLSIYPTPTRDEAQNVYAHRDCLDRHLHSDVPRHPSI